MKRKRIYYIPGIISLLVLPILFYSYNNRYQKTHTQTILQLNIWSPDLLKRFPTNFKDEYPSKRKYVEICLTGDDKSDKVKLDFLGKS
jgi:hypothetical protein